MIIEHTARPCFHRAALALVAGGLMLSLTGCAGAGADKPAQPPAGGNAAAGNPPDGPPTVGKPAGGKGVSAPVPRELHPVMPAPVSPPSSAMAPETDAGACNAEAARRFVGQPATAAHVEAARAAAAPSGTVRVIAPGQAVTMDYRGDRLNVEIDARRVILSLRCG